MIKEIFNNKIAIIGLGYVGLPLAVEFGKKFKVNGYDVNLKRISELKKFYDVTNELSKNQIKKSKYLRFTSNIKDIINSNIYIITVPTPILKNKKPNLIFLKKACKEIGKILKKKDIVIFESTVYPGVTEDICVPVLEKQSGLKYNFDFYCGYSPERINPGDKKHKLKNIVKVISGSNLKVTIFIQNLYNQIIKAGTFRASSIKVAESAKVIENSQRDLNIAFVNEISIIFNKMNLNTAEILRAASTKWNFLDFKPGLVGGHCIGVDPYYLAYISKKIGHQPKVILSGRKVNDYMGKYVAKKSLNYCRKKLKQNRNIKFLICGFSFKEDCNDCRNSKVYDIYSYLKYTKNSVDVYDPQVNSASVKKYYKIILKTKLKFKFYDCIILAVGHKFFKKIGYKKLTAYLKKDGIFIDLKNCFNINNEFKILL